MLKLPDVARVSCQFAFTCAGLAVGLIVISSAAKAQEKSVRPGINDSFRDPVASEFVERFEIESREVFAKRKEIVQTLKLKKGSTIGDIGAGTGLFTRLFSDAVGPDGQVMAVDIAKNFLDHITRTSRETGRKNIHTVLCTPESTNLMENSLDVAFICDTYHHFEFPLKTMRSLQAALKPSGRLFVIDFERIEGKTSDWTMNHVRAGQEVFEREILSYGFRKVTEYKDTLNENYFLEFAKADEGTNDG